MAVVDEVQIKEGVDQETVDAVRQVGNAYKHGWETEIEMDFAPLGLDEDIVRLISSKNEEPEWMTEWRLGAYRLTRSIPSCWPPMPSWASRSRNR
jgi:Fe-S cluster assembly protein SufB